MSKNAYIISGVGDILNRENIKPGIDLKELENKLINGGLLEKVKDPHDKFKDELRETAKNLGISFGEFESKKQNISAGENFTRTTNIPTVVHNEEVLSINEDSLPLDISIDDSDSESSDSDESDSDDDTTPDTFSRSSLSFSDDLASRTKEQERRDHIDRVIGNTGSSEKFSFEGEKREDMKCAMLEEIDSLMNSLAEENVDLSRIPHVDRNSSYGEVETVQKMLRHKNDRTRYCSFAEELLLSGACALEELFDGKRTWFGYQPDLTGWHNQVNVKLRRMRHDTSTIVGDIMQDYNVGPCTRMALELLPNMILYSRMRRNQYDEPGYFNDAERMKLSSAMDEDMARMNERIRMD